MRLSKQAAWGTGLALVVGVAGIGGMDTAAAQGVAPAEPTEAVDPAPGKVLISQLAAVEVPEAVATHASLLVAEMIGRRGGWSVVTFAEAQELMTAEQTQQLVGCKSDAPCLSRASEATKTDYVISGELGMLGLSVTINLALTETATRTVKRRVSGVGLRSEAMHDDLKGLVDDLLGGAAVAKKERFALDRDRELSFAVFDLQASGVEAEMVTSLTQVLADTLKGMEQAKVIGKDDIVAMLSFESDRQLLGCTDTACLAEIGGALGVSYLTAGTVGKVADTWVISLRLMDPRAAEVVNRVTESFNGDPDQIFGALRHAARRLVGIETSGVGVLAVSSTEPEAKLFIDGEEQGVFPLDPLAGLPPGRHSLRVSKEDFVEWSSDVYVDPGQATAVRVRLLEVPTEWYESWIFWTIAGGVALAAAGTTVGLVLGLEEKQRNTNTFPTFSVSLPE